MRDDEFRFFTDALTYIEGNGQATVGVQHGTLIAGAQDRFDGSGCAMLDTLLTARATFDACSRIDMYPYEDKSRDAITDRSSRAPGLSQPDLWV